MFKTIMKVEMSIDLKSNALWTQIIDFDGSIKSSYTSDCVVEALQKASNFLNGDKNIIEELKEKIHRRNVQIADLKQQIASLQNKKGTPIYLRDFNEEMKSQYKEDEQKLNPDGDKDVIIGYFVEPQVEE